MGITLHVDAASLAAALVTAVERAAITILHPITAEVVSWNEHKDRAAMFSDIPARTRPM